MAVILIFSHVGHGDLCKGGPRAGCVDLLHHIQNRIKPMYHIFGHIHEGKLYQVVCISVCNFGCSGKVSFLTEIYAS